LRNIDPRLSRTAIAVTQALRPRIGVALAVAALCATVAGCVSDTMMPAAENPGGSQLRYYGGPKSPMWPSQ
jgi:hypothetical protein